MKLMIILSFCFLFCFACKVNKQIQNTQSDSIQTVTRSMVNQLQAVHVSAQTVSNVQEDAVVTLVTREYFPPRDSNTIPALKKETIQTIQKKSNTAIHQTLQDSTKNEIHQTDSVAVSLNHHTIDKESIQTDSRPVQGLEWLWIVLGIGAVLFFLCWLKNKY